MITPLAIHILHVVAAVVTACLPLVAHARKPVWQVGLHVGSTRVLDNFPSSRAFWRLTQDKLGRPFVIRGEAMRWPGYGVFRNDTRMAEEYGNWNVKVQGREVGSPPLMKLADFLESYRSKPLYLTSYLKLMMKKDVLLPEIFHCGGLDSSLIESNIWQSSGPTLDALSTVHSRPIDVIHCQLSGSKHWTLWDPRQANRIKRSEMGWVLAKDSKDGMPFANISVQNVDLQKHPEWAKLEYQDLTVDAGDCHFVPMNWLYYSRTLGEHDRPSETMLDRMQSVTIEWNRPSSLNETDCGAKMTWSEPLTLADCTWRAGAAGGKTECVDRNPSGLDVDIPEQEEPEEADDPEDGVCHSTDPGTGQCSR